jgi:hypothetical protein
MRRAAHVDSNQAEIVEVLRYVGATVAHLHTVGGGVPDLVVGYKGRNYLLEVKPGDAKDKRRRALNDNERTWHSQWGGQAAVVLDPLHALGVIGAPCVCGAPSLGPGLAPSGHASRCPLTYAEVVRLPSGKTELRRARFKAPKPEKPTRAPKARRQRTAVQTPAEGVSQ